MDLVKTFKTKNITVIPVENSKEACDKILKIIPEKASIGYGGSITLEQIGILDKIRQSDYLLYDRTKVTKYTKESYQLGHSAQHADYFLSSSNAITEDGKIVNKDRTGNRVSSLIYGPDQVIIVVGKNKIVKNLDEALNRIKNIAAPLNAKRMKLNTPCVETGKCLDCPSPERICCNTVIIERQFKPDRMTIILVNEDLGY